MLKLLFIGLSIAVAKITLHAEPQKLANIEFLGAGYVLHWFHTQTFASDTTL
jgi:hypothetical protein